jgi:NO-binding membrane sensor protein with MHYT domain
VTGSVVGLACTRQSAAASDKRDRLRWLAMAAIAIGGVAIWLMHFIAMLGFATPGSVVRYNLGWTVASAVLSISAVFVGLITIGRTVDLRRLIAGGVITGLAVALMHYTGMWAVQTQARSHTTKALSPCRS